MHSLQTKRAWRTFRQVAPLALVVGYFLWLIWPGTREYFNPDDTMNLCVAWYNTSVSSLIKSTFGFWMGAIRPFGSLYYRLVYEVAGFHPFLFRATCFLLLILNLVLAYRFFQLLTNSRRETFLASFVGCFHGAMWNIYASTGTVYDILCQTFVLTAVNLYIAHRSRENISWPRAAAIWLAHVLALGSKEMAYTLPLVFLSYELVFRLPASWAEAPAWLARQFRVAGVTGIISTAAWIGRKAGQHAPDDVYGYQILLTGESLLRALQQYLHLLFFKTVTFTGAQALALIGAALICAILFRSRLMTFGWLYAMVLAIPLLIVPPRHSGYVLYVPFTGCVLYFIGAVRVACSWLERLAGRVSQSELLKAAPMPIIYSVILAAAAVSHVAERRLVWVFDFAPGGGELVRTLSEDMLRLYPSLPPNTRILFINDAFKSDTLQPQFILHLTYGDKSLKVAKMTHDAKSGALTIPPGSYDHVFEYDGTRYREVRGR